MSLDSQSSTTPYESSSFATPEGELLAVLCIKLSGEQTSLSGVHSEHILKERQRRAKCSESFHL